MAAQNVCRYFKFGHCKFSDKCRFMHVNEKCENTSCNISSCNLRHPRICKYFRDYRRCKFGEWCSFDHNIKDIFENQSITEINEKLNELSKAISEKDKLIAVLVEKLKDIELHLFPQTSSEEITDTQPEEVVTSFKCDECDFEFNTNKGLSIHKGKKHGNKTTCDICDKKFDYFRDIHTLTTAHCLYRNKFAKNVNSNVR